MRSIQTFTALSLNRSVRWCTEPFMILLLLLLMRMVSGKILSQLIKELKIRTLRWPGGNFVASYYWEDGIGPKDQRPARLDLAWNQIEKNQMGTDEYVKLTSLIGAESFVCVNGGTGTLQDATNWVEYCNYEKGTYYSDLRRKYGNEKPYGIKYWALGNEVDGPWQMAQKTAEDYVKWALEAQKMMNIVDKNIKYHSVRCFKLQT